MRPATDCPACPECTATVGVLGPTGALLCCACGHEWPGTPEERAHAERADAAYEAELAAEMEREEQRRGAAIARRAFEDAGRPVPEWLVKMEAE